MKSALGMIADRKPAGMAPTGSALLAALGVAVILAIAGTQVQAAGQVDVFTFDSPEQAARYRTLIDEFRCPKCLNTNLSGSDAPIARDLRSTVRRLMVEEDMSDAEIREFLQARYGDFVLYDPPFKPGTWLLWLAPVGFLLIGAWVLFRVLRPRAPLALSQAEQDRIQALLRDAD